ncbi:MAG: hypothetical protein PF638_16070 [Candidatus Delongbacteria bacterium]|jgi:hypothetical protein|nr:hypothetical protein [Candidatus Delongbacteria bacterium]
MKQTKSMKLTVFCLISLTIILFIGCTNISDPETETVIINKTLIFDELKTDTIGINQEIWYDVDITGFNYVYILWEENENNFNYSGDIRVSAYYEDGITPYFEDKNSSYNSWRCNYPATETKIKIKVSTNNNIQGTFAIRALVPELIEFPLNVLRLDQLTESEVSDERFKWFSLSKNELGTKFKVEWFEVNDLYDANIKVTAYKQDGCTIIFGPEDTMNNNGNIIDLTNDSLNYELFPFFLKVESKNEETFGSFALKVKLFE